MKIGVAGLTHGHVWGLMDGFARLDGVELSAVADKTPLLDKARERFAATYADWREMLDRERIDALLVTSDNRESANIAVEALGRGIPCIVEKAMAADAKDADRMLEAMRKSGKILMINWPTAWRPAFHQLKTSIEGGEIGTPFHLRFRTGHWGPREIGCDEWFVGWLYDEYLNGGGAIADFCGYGAVLCRWLFGMPSSVWATRDNFTKDYEVPDDHAVCVLLYGARSSTPAGEGGVRKMTAILEGTWATKGFDRGPGTVVHGKEGTLAIYDDKTLVKHTPGESTELEVPPLMVDNPAQYFMDCVQNSRQPEGILNPEIAADACRIIDAAKKSASSGCAERL